MVGRHQTSLKEKQSAHNEKILWFKVKKWLYKAWSHFYTDHYHDYHSFPHIGYSEPTLKILSGCLLSWENIPTFRVLTFSLLIRHVNNTRSVH